MDRPPKPTGPAIRNAGVYDLLPDADIRISFSGEVSLPPGRWTVGIVQNLWSHRVLHAYSEGGAFEFSENTIRLDVPNLFSSDIWLNTFGTGVVDLENTSSADRRFTVTLEGGDTPTSPPIPGLRTRCGITPMPSAIREQLSFAERVLQLAAALVARKNGEVFPLASSGRLPYGMMWRLEPANGEPNFKFKSLFPADPEISLPFQLWGAGGVVTSGVTANAAGVAIVAAAEAAYQTDCVRRAPRGFTLDL